jgi:hypothetical protein
MTMLERAARAAAEVVKQPLHNLPSLEPVLVGSLGDAWKPIICAVLTAIREPDAGMIEAGFNADPLACDVNEADKASVYGGMWSAMVDEILMNRK